MNKFYVVISKEFSASKRPSAHFGLTPSILKVSLPPTGFGGLTSQSCLLGSRKEHLLNLEVSLLKGALCGD